MNKIKNFVKKKSFARTKNTLKKMANYQKFIENKDGIELLEHTLMKAMMVTKAFNILPPSDKQIKVIDIGSAEGLLSLHLWQEFPERNIDITQVNPTTVETNFAKKWVSQYFPEKQAQYHLYPSFWRDVPRPATPDEKYDIVLFFAIFHHILHTFESDDEVMKELLRYVKHVCILEVPLEHDALLNIWKTKNPQTSYACLDTKKNFETLLKKYFTIHQSEEIQYAGPVSDQKTNLCRWCYILTPLTPFH